MKFPFNSNISLYKTLSFVLIALAFSVCAYAQPQQGGRPGGTGAGQPGRPAPKGRVNGKLFDATTNKPIEFVVLRVY